MNLIDKWILSYRRKSADFLFDGDDLLFKKLITTSKTYGEYGVGKSTRWVLNNSQASILAVDSSQAWIDVVRTGNETAKRLDIQWIDLGTLGWAGRPGSYEKRDQFWTYIESIWNRDQRPDLVLVDGRFRVACFLYSLAMGAPGTHLLFDDYTDRPEYHLVEEFIKPVQTCGRQALFTIPEQLDQQLILTTARQFCYVLD